MKSQVKNPASDEVSNLGRRLLFKVVGNIDRDIDVDIQNKSEIMPDGAMSFSADPWSRGFDRLNGRPKFYYKRKSKRRLADCEEYLGWWIVSERMKKLLETFDPAACAFLKCDLQLADGSSGPPIWLCDVIRLIDAVDEDASDIEIAHWESGRKVYSRWGRKIVFCAEIVEKIHLFRVIFSPGRVFCSNEFRKACRSEGIKGIRFTKYY